MDHKGLTRRQELQLRNVSAAINDIRQQYPDWDVEGWIEEAIARKWITKQAANFWLDQQES